MSNFEDFIQIVEKSTKKLAKNTLKGFKNEALKDVKTFLEDSKEDLKRWTRLLAIGELSQDDFEWLVIGRKEVIELQVLKQSGLTLVRLDRFKNALLNSVIDTALDVFL
ncbi:MAG: hypothetical protein KAH03_00020 [Cocleimonas sp.]|nr:hypothetical protein [Cocleimonas sp.]